MKKKAVYAVLLAACVVALLAAFVFPGIYQPNILLKSFSDQRINYDSANPAKAIYKHLEGTRTASKSFRLTMDFEPTSIGGYNDVFQTAPANSGVRLELSKPNTLALIVGAKNTDGYRVFVISEALSLGKWHTFSLDIDSQDHITVTLDGRKSVDETDPDMAYDLSDIEVGTGISGTRPFIGQVRNATFSYRLFAGTGRITALRITFFVLICVLLFLIDGLDNAEEEENDGAEQANGTSEKRDWPSRRFRGDEV